MSNILDLSENNYSNQYQTSNGRRSQRRIENLPHNCPFYQVLSGSKPNDDNIGRDDNDSLPLPLIAKKIHRGGRFRRSKWPWCSENKIWARWSGFLSKFRASLM